MMVTLKELLTIFEIPATEVEETRAVFVRCRSVSAQESTSGLFVDLKELAVADLSDQFNAAVSRFEVDRKPRTARPPPAKLPQHFRNEKLWPSSLSPKTSTLS